MSFTIRRSVFSGVFLLSAGICTFANADSVSLQMKVLDKQEGFVEFQLQAENISLISIQEVLVTSNNDNIPAIHYGDIDAGKTAVRVVSLDWDANEEPPQMEWSITYSDTQGNTYTQTN